MRWMRKFYNNNKIILGILVLATVLRLWGIGYGFPNILFNDEKALVYGALKMMELKTLVPAWHQTEFEVLYYLPAMSYVYLIYLAPMLALKYLLAGFPDLALFKAQLILDPTFLWYAARVLNVLIGVLAVWAVYKISIILFKNKNAAILSALFLALSFYHVQLSHMSRHWVPAVTFTLLALMFAAMIYKNPKTSYYVWGGIFGGLAVGTNPSSAVVALPLFLAHVFNQKIFSRRLLIGVLFFAGVSAMFVALHPYGITLGEGQKDASKSLMARLEIFYERGLGEFYDLNVKFLKALWDYEVGLLILGVLGSAVLWRKDKRVFYMMVSFAAAYVALLYLMNITYLTRPVLYLIPVLAISAGLFSDFIIERLAKNKSAMYLILILMFIYPIALSIKYDVLLAREDSRALASDWLAENLAGEKIITHLPYMNLTNSKEGILAMRNLDEGSLRVNDKLLLNLPDENYSKTSFTIFNLHFLPLANAWRQKLDSGDFIKDGYRYLVVEYRNKDKSDLDKQALILAGQGKLIKRFEGELDVMDEISVPAYKLFNMKKLGPIIEVYEL